MDLRLHQLSVEGFIKDRLLGLHSQFLISRAKGGAREVAFQTKSQVTGDPDDAGLGATL